MRNFIISLLLFLSPALLIAQDSASVLFIGNSYTYYNDMPGLFQDLSSSLGKATYVDSKVNGGATMQVHANDPVSYQKMHNSNWDYVVLQAQSQEPSFPYGQVNSQTLPYAVQLADSVHSIYDCSQAMFFMTWGRENGDPQWDSINTFDKMNERLRNAYLRFAESSDGSVSPVGVAWKYVRDNHPTISLYAGDGSHPKPTGSYLAACTFYASIFHESPVGSTFLGGLDASTAEILQNAAAIAVLDSLPTWHLKHHDSLAHVSFESTLDPVAFSASFEENTSYIDNFIWDFGDGNTSTDSNPSHTFGQSGTYNVQLIGYGPCGNDTITNTIVFENTSGLVSHYNEASSFEFRTISEHVFELQGKDGIEIGAIQLIDMTGRPIKYKTILEENSRIRIETLHKGVLILIFDQIGRRQILRFYK
ncbi:MAG: PKD domain-containing protein [Crocinitomicaceae bacterium]|nr:PKD domain-containing protein [Crocinitomicaceae bacterium]